MVSIRYILILVCLQASYCMAYKPKADSITFQLNAPRPDDVVEKYRINYLTPGSSGYDKVWDFGNLEIMDRYNIKYVGNECPRMLECHENSIMRKHSLASGSLHTIGYETPLIAMEYDAPLLMQIYPFSYGESSCQAFHGKGIYCGKNRIKTDGEVYIEADAEGIIVLSETDTLKNVLRMHTTKTASLDMNILNDTAVYDIQNVKHEIEEHYLWYCKGYRYPMFESVVTTYYNNMEHVSCSKQSFCCLPDAQRLLKDSLNEDIAHADTLSVENQNIIKYIVSVNNGKIVIYYDLASPASISTVVCDKMGLVSHRYSVNQDRGDGYTISLDCVGMRKGVYILYLKVNDKTYSEKLNI